MKLAECQKEIETLKDNITKSETERKSVEESVRVYIEVINQQKEEISQLRENLQCSEYHKVGTINIPEKTHKNIERYDNIGAEEKNNVESDVIKRNTQRNGKLNVKKQGVTYSGAIFYDTEDRIFNIKYFKNI